MKYKVGDIVKIKNSGFVYGTMESWMIKYASKFIDKWVYGENPNAKDIYKILVCGEHEWGNNNVYLIKNLSNNQAYMIGEKGIKLAEDIIEYKGKKYDVVHFMEETILSNAALYLKEHKEEILDEAEKEYLRNVIKYVIEPTHNEVHCITKHKDYDGYMININFENNDGLSLPYFKDKRMYKGMELDKEYTLEDLQL